MFAGFALLMTLSAAQVSTQREPVVAPPQWLEAPQINVQDYYPAQAFKAKITGKVVVAGDIAATGELHCRVVSEEPANAGFGQAGLEICRRFRLSPLTVDGVPADGGVVEVPITFKVE